MSARKLSQRLPNKMSSLLLLALRDLERTEKDPRYEIDMGNWHRPPSIGSGTTTCAVCMAGSVLAQRGFLRINQDWRFERNFHPAKAKTLYNKVHALNFLRCGHVSSAASRLGLPDLLKTAKFNRGIVDYLRDPVLFKEQLTTLALDLRKAGL